MALTITENKPSVREFTATVSASIDEDEDGDPKVDVYEASGSVYGADTIAVGRVGTDGDVTLYLVGDERYGTVIVDRDALIVALLASRNYDG